MSSRAMKTSLRVGWMSRLNMTGRGEIWCGLDHACGCALDAPVSIFRHVLRRNGAPAAGGSRAALLDRWRRYQGGGVFRLADRQLSVRLCRAHAAAAGSGIPPGLDLADRSGRV